MKKRILACMLVFVLLLSACSTGGADPNVKRLGEPKSRRPLRICVDVAQSTAIEPGLDEDRLNDLLFRLQETAGLEDVVIEIIPPPETVEGGNNYAVRKTVLDRLRTEIMAGEGPDVFIQSYVVYSGIVGLEYDRTDCLFKYPEKAMENGIFLPLDEYIENHAEYAEWDKLLKPVLDAGRNAEGQQIIPLNYTFPVLCWPKAEWEHIPDKTYTWNDLLTNPDLQPYAADLVNCLKQELRMYMDGGSETVNEIQYDYIHYILGNIADFDSEELSFTEEELLAIVKDILAQPLQDKLDENPDAWELNASRELAQSKINKPVTFLPLYAADGGVTAYISHFAAVNRNTKRPEDAFKVIEILMSKHFQRWSDMSSHMLCGRLSLPLHEDLFSPAEPIVGNNYFMTEENFEAFKAVRAQITGANFESEGTVMLSEMLNRCSHAADFGMTVEEIVHETYKMLERRLKE